MRATVSIDDDLFSRLKELAERDKTSLSTLINEALRRELRAPVKTRQSPRQFRQKTYDMGEPLVDLTKALALAAQLEDEETIARLALHNETH